MRPMIPIAVVLALAACTDKDTGDTDPDTDSDTMVDPGTDPDTDTEADTEPDTDVDTDFVRCEPQTVTLPHTISGESFFDDYPNDGQYNIGENCAEAQGPEYTIAVDLVAGELLTAQDGGEDLSPVFHVKSACTTYAECLASVDQDFDGRLEFLAPETGTYYVITETFNANPVDPYSISYGIAEPEDCTDGVDNDVDGLIDCADQDQCRTFPACIEVCDDGIDNDADGFTDCEDNNSCFGVGDCVAACQEDEIAIDALPFSLSGTNFSADWPNNFNYSDGEGCGTGNGHEIVMAIDMTFGTTYRIQETGPGDMVIRVMDTCVEDDICHLSSDFPETVDYTADRDGLHYIIVEGWSSTPTSAAWSVDVGIVEDEVCNDGIDNDLDGRADCDDLDDCYGDAACPFECPATDYPAEGRIEFVGDRFIDVSTGVGPYDTGDGCTTSGSGEAVVWEVALEADEGILVRETGTMDAVWRVMTSCDPGDACLYSSDTDSPSDWIYQATEAETVFVVLESWSASETDPVNATVQVVVPEICDDGIDNDGDNATDCFDLDCYDPVTCPVDCGEAAELPIVMSGDDFTVDFANAASYTSGEGCTSASGAEARFQVSLSEGEELAIQENGGLDVILRVLDNCVGGSECLLSIGFPEQQSFVAPADGEYTVVVEASSASPFIRDYEIVIGIVEPEICTDGLDNDFDGVADCADPDCYDPVTCPYECPGDIITLPFNIAGDNFSAQFTDNLDYSVGEGCGTGNGPEGVWQVQMLAGESIHVSDTGGADLVVRMAGESCLPADTCFISQDFPEDFIFQAPEDGLYTVIVEGWSSTPSTGSFDITIEAVPPEDCFDGVDNDLDDAVDCFDPDCFDPIECPVECVIEDDVLPTEVAGSDFPTDFPNNFDFSNNENCDGALGSEVFYEVDMLAGETLRILEEGTLSSIIRVLDSCDPGAACIVDTASEALDFTADEDGTYLIVVEGEFASPFSIAYDISLEMLLPEECSGGVDEDLDGLIDCDDPDCFGEEGLCDTETACFDAQDNDDDGATDCDDTECADVLGCGGSGTLLIDENFDTWPLTDWLVDEGTGSSPWIECSDTVAGCDAQTDFAEPFAGASGSFAYINSDDNSGDFDKSLVSPAFDLTGYTNVLMVFDHFYNYFSGDVAYVEYTNDGGTTWVELASYTSADIVGSEMISLDAIAGESAVQVRFRYEANFDWWWAIDNVRVEAL